MAMSLTAIRRRLAAIRDVSPNRVACSYSGTDFYAVKTLLKQDMRYSENGYAAGYSFSLIANRADLTNMPADKSEITVAGTIYIITMTEVDPANAAMIIHCAERNA
jgi:hypothetical protein